MIKRIKIGMLTYEVRLVDRMRGDAGQYLFGEIDYTEQVISIASETTPDRQEATLWHEVVHGILEATGQRDNVTESAVVALGLGIAQVLADNPALLQGKA